MTRARAVTVVLVVMMAAAEARAQRFAPEVALSGAPMTVVLRSRETLQQAATLPAGGRAPPSAAARAALEFKASSAPVAPHQLAETYPEVSRAQAEAFFEQTLVTYHLIERKFGLRRGDLPGALAAFIAGSLIASRDERLPDEVFRPLVDQLRPRMGQVESLQRATSAEKQVLYEQLAIMGMFMAVTREELQKTPDAGLQSKLRGDARLALQTVLGVDPDRVQLTVEGLVVSEERASR